MESLFSGSTGLEHLFHELLILSMHGSIVVIAVFVLQRFLKQALSPKWVYTIWILAIIRFVVLAAPASPVSFQNLMLFDKNQPSIPIVGQQSVPVQGRWEFNENPDFNGSFIPAKASFPWGYYLAITWLAGCLCLLGHLAVAWRRTQQIVSGAYSMPPDLLDIFHESKCWTGVSRHVEVLVTDQLSSPAAMGLFRPMVLLPSWCITTLDREQLRCVFVHELTHLKKNDIWVQLTAHLVSIAHWFNPLVALAASRLDTYREMACDQRSIELLTKFNVSEPKVLYGNVILRVATYCSGQSRPSKPVFVGSFVDFNKQQIQQRIAMLVRHQPPKLISSVMAMGLVIFMLAIGFTSAQTQTNEIEKTAAPPNDTVAVEPDEQFKFVVERLPSSSPVEAEEQQVFVPPYDLELVELSPKQKIFLQGIRGISLAENETKTLEFKQRIPSLVIGDPEVINIRPITSNKLVFEAKSWGTTPCTVVFDTDKTVTFDISVRPRPDKIAVPKEATTVEMKILRVDKSIFAATENTAASSVAELIGCEPFTHESGNVIHMKQLDAKSENLKLLDSIGRDHPAVELLQCPKVTTIIGHEASLMTEFPASRLDEFGNKITQKIGTKISITPRKSADPNQIELLIKAIVTTVENDQNQLSRRLSTGIVIEFDKTMLMCCSYEENGKAKELVLLLTPSHFEAP